MPVCSISVKSPVLGGRLGEPSERHRTLSWFYPSVAHRVGFELSLGFMKNISLQQRDPGQTLGTSQADDLEVE